MSLTLTYDPQLSRVRIVADGLGALAMMRVERSTDQVRWTTVRGGELSLPVSGEIRVDDYEFAPDVPNFYRVVGATAWDEYSRVSAAGWGNAPSGQVWQHFGTAAAFTANGNAGQHIHSTTNSGRISVVDVGSTRARVRVTSSVPAVAQPAGTALTVYAIARFTDDANFYQCRLGFIPDLNITCSIRKRVAGVDTTLDSIVLPGVTHVPGTRYVVELDASGSLLLGRAWREGDPEPDWQVSATDTALTTGTKVGIRTIIDAGSTNTLPFTYTLDDFLVTVPFRTIYSGSVTPALGGVWLKSLARPFLNRQVTVRDVSEVIRRSRAGVFDVVGRSFPVAVTDVRGSRQWTLDLSTYSEQDRSDLDLLLASGDVLLVQVPPAAGRLSATPAGYVVVGDTREITPPTLDLAMRVFSLPCVEAAAPGPDVVGATSNWQTVLNTYATWADLLTAHATWGSVLELVGDPEDVIVS
ncbi:hypothetical protein DKT68_15240 [Micromonospora acroterricola]|uniref:Uncharacterized protein n=1 Tax=Micromonospora acroterricola TaxID=2202421 RepID=A0A317D1J6_9ACTN|nr:hypothetical protein [Micromonospora acroterricola]PWR08569.1 hypothetical protein DKT68_15240 [Micromonospora acroterricola]